jgi:F-type H+-transporting ATPase subunit gamma
MATLRDIRRRITGVKNTQKITKAMKMVAAAKLRRAQDSIISARPYARQLKELLQHLATTVGDEAQDPLFVERPVRNVLLIVVTADRGLCGPFNINVAKGALAHLQTTLPALGPSGAVQLICVGKKGTDFFQKQRFPIAAKHVGIFSALNFAQAQTIVKKSVDAFLGGEVDRVEVIYNEFKSIMQQRVVVEQLLPVPPVKAPAESLFINPRTGIDYIYEPSRGELIGALLPKHLNFQMWRVLLESCAAEHAARMTSMDNATTNATEIIHDLQLVYNKARQASITKELLEIVSGAEALKKAG